MTTVADWVEDCKQYLQSDAPENMNLLSEAYVPGDGQLSLVYDLKGIVAGSTLSAGIGNFMTLATTPSTKRVDVLGGWQGAEDVSLPSGTIVYVRPRYSTFRIFRAINQTLNEMASPGKGLFAVAQLDLDIDPTQTVYDLSEADALQDVLAVQYAQDVTDIEDLRPTVGEFDWEFRRITPTAQFPAGTQLRIHDLIDYAADTTATVTYKRTFVAADSLEADISTTLVLEGMEDLPPLGAASKLAGPGEMRRNRLDAQGDTRRAEEVPAGATLGAARELRRMYQDRINEEIARALQSWPPRLRI